MDDGNLSELISRYVGMWHEPDATARRRLVRSLFTDDATNVTPAGESHGVDEITARVTRAYTEWVAQKGFVFEPAGNTDAHHDVVKFVWRMLPRGGGEVASAGLDILVLQADGRIHELFQFIEPLHSPAYGSLLGNARGKA